LFVKQSAKRKVYEQRNEANKEYVRFGK